MRDQTLTDHRSRTDHDIQHPFGQTGLEGQFGEAKGGERGELGRLEHDCVAARESGPKLPAGEHEGEVPRHDQAHDAERLAKCHVHAARHGNRFAIVLLDRARVEVKDVADHTHLPSRIAYGLAHVGRFQAGQLFAMLLDFHRDAPQQPRAVGGFDGLPRRIRSLRRRDGAVGFLEPRAIEPGDRFFSGGVDHLHLAGHHRHPRSNSLSRS